MPRFFFDVHDGETDRDTEGTELSGLKEARSHAARIVGNLVSKDMSADNDEDWRVEVSNEERLILFTVIVSVVESAAIRQIG